MFQPLKSIFSVVVCYTTNVIDFVIQHLYQLEIIIPKDIGPLPDYPQTTVDKVASVIELGVTSKKNSIFVDIVQIGGGEVNPMSKN